MNVVKLNDVNMNVRNIVFLKSLFHIIIIIIIILYFIIIIIIIIIL